MALRMATPTKHPKTGIFYFRRRVPSNLVAALGKREHKVSLGTRDPATAKVRFAEKCSEFDKLEKLARAKPEPLPLKTIVALSGEAYRHLVNATDAQPGETELWDVLIERIEREASSGNMEGWYGPGADTILNKHELKADEASRERLLVEIHKAVRQAAEFSRRKSQGDYSEDPMADRFPKVTKGKTAKRAPKGLDLEWLLDHKAKTVTIRPKTVRDNRSYIREFIEFTGFGDARKVTKKDIRDWRDHLIETGLATKTINDRRLSAVRSVLSHAVAEFDLEANVASGIRDQRDPDEPKGPKGYTVKEATAVLKKTFSSTTKELSDPHVRAVFWVPWLLVYTGQRVTELTQLRGSDLLTVGDIPHLLITPSSGSNKSRRAWAVGIHRHLIELGFLNFVREMGKGPLFYEPYPASVDLTKIEGKHRAQEASTRVSRWIRDAAGGYAPLNRPSHAMRHLFTTLSRTGDKMDREARNFMLGSRPKTDAREGYGEWPPSVLNAEINKLSRFEVEDKGWRP